MWTKRYAADRGQVVYHYEPAKRPLQREERDGSDVYEHFRRSAIENVERGHLPPNYLRLHQGDISYPKAIAAFYAE